jgi:DEAD/DEAH box helicase
LSYNPTILIATPGRLWELLNERSHPYLVNELPLIDVLVLDEADRMIEDGHFKEMKLILDFIYNKRVEYRKQALGKLKAPVEEDPEKRAYKQKVLEQTKGKQKEYVLKDIEGTNKKVDLS